jgi:membrane protease YdiL (CAAX protease family)
MGISASRPARASGADPAFAIVLVSIGILALLLRRSVLGTPQQVPLLVEIYVGLALVSLVVPIEVRPGSGLSVPVVLAVGIAAFAVATFATRPPNVLPHGPEVVVLNSLAALSEEAFFRRFAYGVLERYATVVAVAGTAVVFALVHVPIYGSAVFWVDLGAGLVLSWQRWASGSWVPSGITHVIANLLAVLR